jgi:hypothetical protein
LGGRKSVIVCRIALFYPDAGRIVGLEKSVNSPPRSEAALAGPEERCLFFGTNRAWRKYVTGLRPKTLDQEQLDLHQRLLPRGLGDCIDLIKRVRGVNESLPIEPEPWLQFAGRQISYFDNYDSGLLGRLSAAEQSYRQALGTGGMVGGGEPNRRRVDQISYAAQQCPKRGRPFAR